MDIEDKEDCEGKDPDCEGKTCRDEDCDEKKRNAIQKLSRLLAAYYVALIESGVKPPKTKEEFIRYPDEPCKFTALLDQIKEVDTTLTCLFKPKEEDKKKTEDKSQIVSSANYDRTGFPLAVGDVEYRVGELAGMLEHHNKKLTKNLENTKVYPDDVEEIFGLYIQAAMKCTVYILSAGIKFIQTQKDLEESNRRRWLILRAIKGVFLHYVKAYLEWGVKVDVIPDRAPSRALQKIAFKGYDFDGLLKNLGVDLSVRNSLHCPDPADPVALYAEMLWNSSLVSLGYYLFSDTPHSEGPDYDKHFQHGSSDETEAENTPPDKESPCAEKEKEKKKENSEPDLGLDGVDKLLDHETNEFIDEIYDAFIHAVGLTPLDSAVELANRLKKRFVDVI